MSYITSCLIKLSVSSILILTILCCAPLGATQVSESLGENQSLFNKQMRRLAYYGKRDPNKQSFLVTLAPTRLPQHQKDNSFCEGFIYHWKIKTKQPLPLSTRLCAEKTPFFDLVQLIMAISPRIPNNQQYSVHFTNQDVRTILNLYFQGNLELSWVRNGLHFNQYCAHSGEPFHTLSVTSEGKKITYYKQQRYTDNQYPQISEVFCDSRYQVEYWFDENEWNWVVEHPDAREIEYTSRHKALKALKHNTKHDIGVFKIDDRAPFFFMHPYTQWAMKEEERIGAEDKTSLLKVAFLGWLAITEPFISLCTRYANITAHRETSELLHNRIFSKLDSSLLSYNQGYVDALRNYTSPLESIISNVYPYAIGIPFLVSSFSSRESWKIRGTQIILTFAATFSFAQGVQQCTQLIEKNSNTLTQFSDVIIDDDFALSNGLSEVPPKEEKILKGERENTHQCENKCLRLEVSKAIDAVRGDYYQRIQAQEYLLTEYRKIREDEESWSNYRRITNHFICCAKSCEERELGEKMRFIVDEMHHREDDEYMEDDVCTDKIFKEENPYKNKSLRLEVSNTIDAVRGDYYQRIIDHYRLEEYRGICEDDESLSNYKILVYLFTHSKSCEEREVGKIMSFRVAELKEQKKALREKKDEIRRKLADDVFIDTILKEENPLEQVKKIMLEKKDGHFLYYDNQFGLKEILERISRSIECSQQLEAAIFLAETLEKSSGLKCIQQIAENEMSSKEKQFEAAKYLHNKIKCNDHKLNEIGEKILKEISSDSTHNNQEDAQKILKEAEGVWCSIM